MTEIERLEQICALRGQLGVLLTQTLQAEATITNRIATLENEIRVQRMLLDQTAPAMRNLQQTITRVDDAIRRQRDQVYGAATPVQTPAKQLESGAAQRSDAGQKQRPRK